MSGAAQQNRKGGMTHPTTRQAQSGAAGRDGQAVPDRPQAQPAGPEKTYFNRLAEGRFSIQRCEDCTRAIFYPRNVCPHCGSMQLEWFDPSGLGTVYATTVVHRKPEQGGNYNVCLVDLDEGIRLMSRVAGIAPQDVRIGARVRAQVETVADVPQLVFFQEQAG